MAVQTRNELGGLQIFHTIEEALEYAKANLDFWKISFASESGERVRFTRVYQTNEFHCVLTLPTED
jgi:hypothetical protein